VGRRRVLALALAAVVVVAVVAAALVWLRSDAAEPSADQPNIVVIMTDDQTLESLRVMPHVDELLAAQGVTFDASVVSFPLCCPSRATFLTGQYSHNNGVRANSPPNGGYEAFESQGTTFPVALQDAGYDTVHIGKYLNGFGTTEPAEPPPGWTEWHGAIDPTSYRYFGFTLMEDGGEWTYDDDEYQTDVYTDLATEIIRERAGEDAPFFLNVAYLAPHANVPEDAPAVTVREAIPAPRHALDLAEEPPLATPSVDEADVSDKPRAIQRLPRLSADLQAKVASAYQRYLETLLAVDEGVEQIVGALEASGQLEDTVVVFTSDNGFIFGQHRIPTGKIWLYEPSIRVPLIVRGPGIPAGESRRSLVANVDLAPTILDLAGATSRRVMDGRSLLPLIRDGDDRPDERAVLLESGGSPDPARRNFGLRTAGYAYFELATGEVELYDLTADPDQLENRAGDPALAATERELAARLDRLRDCAGADCDTG
jgi:arylsulfatase A-like enzyme